MSLTDKFERLKSLLAGYDRVAIAFSGGVDSTLLLHTAAQVLGADRVVALTATGPIFSADEIEQSQLEAAQCGVRQVIFKIDNLDAEAFTQNSPMRCYHCKLDLFSRFADRARGLGFDTVVDGSNLDDLGDYRPGHKALAELNIGSPLLKAGLTKAEIRELSRQAGLSTADKPSMACLASRVPYGTPITLERLQQIERCESFLQRHGFMTCRVRHHDQIARIEVSLDEMPRMIEDDLRIALLAECKAAGFNYVALDLEGYRTGSLNESLPPGTD